MRALPGSKSRPAAGLRRRLAALCYDGVILIGLAFFLTLLLVLARGGDAIPPGSWWYGAGLVATGFVYFGWSWTRGGRTLGARAWGLRLETDGGGSLGWRRAALRFLAAWVLLTPPGLGFVWARWDAAGLCWHDRLSRTRLVHDKS